MSLRSRATLFIAPAVAPAVVVLSDVIFQVTDASGTVLGPASPGATALPVDDEDRAIAADGGGPLVGFEIPVLKAGAGDEEE